MTDAEQPYETLEFTESLFNGLIGADFTATDRRRLVRALRLLDANERHSSLRVHQLEGQLRGLWSASASDQLHITYVRREGGRKMLLTCSRHYHR